jgi:hypothetical protein
MKLTLEITQTEPGKFSVTSPDIPDVSVCGIGIDPPSAISSFAEQLEIFRQNLIYAMTRWPERPVQIKQYLPYIQSLWSENIEPPADLDEVGVFRQTLIDSTWFLVDATQDAIRYISNIEETNERQSKRLEYSYKKATLPPTEGEQILEKLRNACLAVYSHRYGGWSCGNSWGDLVIAAPLMFHAISRIAEWSSQMCRCPFCGRMYAGHGHMGLAQRPELELKKGASCVMSEVWEALAIVKKTALPWSGEKNFAYPEKLTKEKIEEIRVMALSRIADGDLETGVPMLLLIEHIAEAANA